VFSSIDISKKYGNTAGRMPTPLQLLEMSNRLVSLGTSNFGQLFFLLIPESFFLSERKIQE
jgi:hypothetical protein